jgi:hypothetical protein
MTAIAPNTDDVRPEAARLAAALIRFGDVAAHPTAGYTPPNSPRVGTDAYIFAPSGRQVPRNEVERFLISLPSPAILSHTTWRGLITLTLLHELSGDRRRGAEKAFSNLGAGLEEIRTQLGLSDSSRILVEFDEESHVFSFAAVREWSQQFVVQVGLSLGVLKGEKRADARLLLRHSDGRPFPGRSDMIRAVRE